MIIKQYMIYIKISPPNLKLEFRCHKRPKNDARCQKLWFMAPVTGGATHIGKNH